MLKILEFIEVGEYETAWSLAVATGREERLVDVVREIAKETSFVEMRVFDFYREVRSICYSMPTIDNIPFHDLSVGASKEIIYLTGSKMFDRAKNFRRAYDHIKAEQLVHIEIKKLERP